MPKISRRDMLLGLTSLVVIKTFGESSDPQAAGVSKDVVGGLLPRVAVPATADKDRILWIVVIAMLRTTAYAEGTWGKGKDAYRTQFSFRQVPESYAYKKHPYDTDGVIPCDGLCSAASGTYQFMPDTWNGVRHIKHKARFWYPEDEFSPRNQDLGAIYLMSDIYLWPILFKGLMVKNGKPVVLRDSFARALSQAAPTWASFPRYEHDDTGAHGQGAKRVTVLWAFFQKQIEALS